ELAKDGVRDGRPVRARDVGTDGEAVDGRRLDDGEIADPRERHVERARDGRGGEGEDVDGRAEAPDALLRLHPEAVLLVDDEEPEAPEHDVLLEQAVRADHDVEPPGGEAGERLLVLRCGAASPNAKPAANSA